MSYLTHDVVQSADNLCAIMGIDSWSASPEHHPAVCVEMQSVISRVKQSFISCPDIGTEGVHFHPGLDHIVGIRFHNVWSAILEVSDMHTHAAGFKNLFIYKRWQLQSHENSVKFAFIVVLDVVNLLIDVVVHRDGDECGHLFCLVIGYTDC